MTNEEREARKGLACLPLEAPPEVCREVLERVEAWVAAAERAIRAEDAALVRAAGCLCADLERAGTFTGGRGELYPEVLVHDHRCPEALAAAIERGKP